MNILILSEKNWDDFRVSFEHWLWTFNGYVFGEQICCCFFFLSFFPFFLFFFPSNCSLLLFIYLLGLDLHGFPW